MAAAVWTALVKGQNLAVEAGTGVGKSLGYLIPAAFWARETTRRVGISTYTRLLQSQLTNQDIPLARKAMPDLPPVAVAYGQDNYLCRMRLATRVTQGLFDTPAEAEEAGRLLDWSETTKDGILLNYPYSLPARLWQRVGRDPATCRRNRCPFRGECFYNRARQSWEKSRILIVNHSLLFAAVTTETDLLPKLDAVVFDEAHRLEDAGVRHFSTVVSQRLLGQTLDTLAPEAGRGLIRQMGYPEPTQAEILAEVAACRTELGQFFTECAGLVPAETGRIRLDEPLVAVPSAGLERLSQALAEVLKDADDEDLAAEVKGAERRLAEAAAGLGRFLTIKPESEVQWLEQQNGSVTLVAAPLNISSTMTDSVYAQFSSSVLTSATLTVAHEFDFLSGRLGLYPFKTLLLDSPFDHAANSLIYLPKRLPPPNDGRFPEAAARELAGIFHATRGRALVLFTSYDMMNQVRALLPELEYPVLVQGDLPTPQLLDTFRKDTHSVLFATQSFWQGIDVPGESLSCLVICRLPFEVPDDPRLTAIAEQLKAEGIEPFTSYQLPVAVLRFRQGFGRLIRTQTDRGVVCVLDRRIAERNYGRVFLASLPEDIPVTSSLSDVVRFLERPGPGPDAP